MSLDRWDAPTGAYTSAIPPGMAAFRKVVAELFGYSRTEVVRDRSRCARTRSEHCECGGVDCFTTSATKGRKLFDACVRAADTLGIQSVIFQHRQIGFGNPNERHRAKADHFDHVHIGINRWARRNLTEAMVRAAFTGVASEEDGDVYVQIGNGVWHLVGSFRVKVNAGTEGAKRWTELKRNGAKAVKASSTSVFAKSFPELKLKP